HAYRRTTCVVAAIYVLHRTPPQPTLFPYTTLFRSGRWALFTLSSEKNDGILTVVEAAGNTRHVIDRAESPVFSPDNRFVAFTIKDRKSTRLNSSHVKISYAVFCLKKKIKQKKNAKW